MRQMRGKTLAVLVFAILALSFIGVFVAAEFPFTTGLGVKGLGTSQWVASNAYTGFYSVEMNSTGVTAGDEGRFIVTLASGIPFDGLYTISWQVYTVLGYPPHVDIFLSSGNVLTAEMAYNNIAGYGVAQIASNLPGYWVKTFELTPTDGFDKIDGSTVFWVANLGSGTWNAPSGTLDEWKAGTGATAGPGDPSETIPDVSSDTIVRLEFEVDNWVVNSESYIDDIMINGLDIMGVGGPKGDTGATGATGPKGSTGPRGAIGIQGATGEQGVAGVNGTDGVDGPIGPQGPQGESIVGPQGLQGEVGEAGNSTIGPQGETGERGLKGDTGEQGPRGYTGEKGDPGPAIVVYGGVALGLASLLGVISLARKP